MSNILQTVQTTLAAAGSVTLTAANTWYNVTDGTTTMSVTITPQSATSKILLLGTLSYTTDATTSAVCLGISDGTNILNLGDAAGSRIRSGWAASAAGEVSQSFQVAKLISSGSTSARTYTIQANNITATGTILYVNRNASDTDDTNHARFISNLIAMEVNV